MTFKQLQDTVLRWMDEEGDTGTVLENVKFALNQSNFQRCMEHQWNWRLSAEQTLPLTEGVKTYTLPTDFSSMVYVVDRVRNTHLRAIPPEELLEAFPNGEWATAESPDAFLIRGDTLELLFTPRPNEELVYRYYTKPVEMVGDDDLPTLPAQHHGLLVWDALLDLKGYHAEMEMVNMVLDRQQRALHTLYQEYGFNGQDVLGARQTRVKMVYDEGM